MYLYASFAWLRSAVCVLFYYLYSPILTMQAQPARACKVAEPTAGDHKTSVEPSAAETLDSRLEAPARASIHEIVEAFMLGFSSKDSMRASYMPRMGSSPVLSERGSTRGQNKSKSTVGAERRFLALRKHSLRTF